MTLPNFFIVGAPKAGTTSLYHYLEEHPEVYMSPIKETNFFSSKEMQEQELYYDATPIQSKNQYLDLFKDVSQEKQVGEASVSYLYYTDVAKKLQEFNPKAKIVIMLRNPVDRAFSHFLMDKRLGLSTSSFMDVIQEPKKFPLHFQQYVLLGNYFHQCSQYINRFGKDNVFITTYHEFKKDTDGVVRSLLNFLDVDLDVELNTNKVHNPYSAPKNKLILSVYRNKSIRKFLKLITPSFLVSGVKQLIFKEGDKPTISREEYNYLVDYFLEDIHKLEALIGKNLSSWKMKK